MFGGLYHHFFKASSNNISLLRQRARPDYFLQPFWGSITTITWRSKMKSNRSAMKRFRVRGNGKLVRNKQGAAHNTGYRTRNRNNRLRQSTTIQNKKLEKKMKKLILAL